MVKKLAAIVFIYLCTVLAWFILGATVISRSERKDAKLKDSVGRIWGNVQVQQAPSVHYQTVKEVEKLREKEGKTIREIEKKTINHAVPLISSDVEVLLSLEHRKKGLLWYPTYTVDFSGTYAILNQTSEPHTYYQTFRFPESGAVYDDFRYFVGDRERKNLDLSSGKARQSVHLAPGERQSFRISYQSQGLEQWGYDFGEEIHQIKDFRLSMLTDFGGFDFPPESISPTDRSATETGWQLDWQYKNLLTGADIALVLPNKLNPGPWVGRVTFSAPVSLFLFFFLLFIFTTLREIRFHPMNYFFIGSAFFTFHLLLAYLVDHISIHAAFLISSAVSVALVVSYMRLVVGNRFALRETAISQLVYMVLFSYTFFFKGYTGLAITILCVLTLFTVMQFTGRVNWDELFQGEKTREGIPPPIEAKTF